MRYSVILAPIADEPGLQGWYNVTIPALELTTQGESVESALAAARELAEVWVQEKRAHGEPVPEETGSLLATIDVDDALRAA